MFTEIKELCNFFVRYLRYRVPCQTLIDFIEHLANLLIIDLDLAWNTCGECQHLHTRLYYWFVNGITSEVYCKAARQSGIEVSLLETLVPKNLVFAVSPGLITYQNMDDMLLLTLWKGSVTEDLNYDPSPLCTKIMFDPPGVTISKTHGARVLYGKPLVVEDFKDSSAFLTDPLMPKAQLIMQLTKSSQNSVDHDYLKDYKGKVFKIERHSALIEAPNCEPSPVSQFVNTRFGSFRTNVVPPPQFGDLENGKHSLTVVEKHSILPPRPGNGSQINLCCASPYSEQQSNKDSVPTESSITPNLSLSMDPVMVVPIKLLRQILTPDQKRILRTFNYACD